MRFVIRQNNGVAFTKYASAIFYVNGHKGAYPIRDIESLCYHVVNKMRQDGESFNNRTLIPDKTSRTNTSGIIDLYLNGETNQFEENELVVKVRHTIEKFGGTIVGIHEETFMDQVQKYKEELNDVLQKLKNVNITPEERMGYNNIKSTIEVDIEGCEYLGHTTRAFQFFVNLEPGHDTSETLDIPPELIMENKDLDILLKALGYDFNPLPKKIILETDNVMRRVNDILRFNEILPVSRNLEDAVEYQTNGKNTGLNLEQIRQYLEILRDICQWAFNKNRNPQIIIEST